MIHGKQTTSKILKGQGFTLFVLLCRKIKVKHHLLPYNNKVVIQHVREHFVAFQGFLVNTSKTNSVLFISNKTNTEK